MDPQWLDWARQLQALAQNGMHHTESPFDRERYEAIRDMAADMMSVPSGAPREMIRALFDAEVGYATPKVDVRGVVFREDRILLVKERRDGLWTLPGGWADVGETPSQAAVREVYEEAGFQCRAVKLLAVYDRSRHGHAPPRPYHIYKLFFLCELIGGTATTSIETDGAEFFGEGAIPPLSLPRTTPSQVARFFEHHRHPDWPADFD